MKSHQDLEEHYSGPFRWRGHLNWKDITERVVSGIVAGLVAGGADGH